jgi:prepilin-type N-terminal cleavage/methylation domain-containing protein
MAPEPQRTLPPGLPHHDPDATMKSNRRGFTIIELIIVVVISTILAGIITLSFSRVQGMLATNSAQTTLQSMHAQTRAFAVERGQVVRLVIDSAQDEVRIEWTNPDTGDNEVLNTVNLGREFAVDVDAGGLEELCFSPRGVGVPDCNSFSGSLTVDLTRGNRVATVRILGLGQIREGGE